MSKSSIKPQGIILWHISKKFNFAAEKIIPESFVLCAILCWWCLFSPCSAARIRWSYTMVWDQPHREANYPREVLA